MSSLLPTIRTALTKFCKDNEGKETTSDILRAIHEEAYLIKETQDLYDTLDSDPMEQLRDVKPQVQQMKKLLQVTSCRRVWTGPYPDYCGIHTVVTFTKPSSSSSNNTSKNPNNAAKSSTSNGSSSMLQLTFRYERKKRQDIRDGCHIWYSIESSQDYGPKESLLVVQVWAQSSSPSAKRAICMNQNYDDDEGGGWQDMDEEEEDDEAIAEVRNNNDREAGNNASNDAELISADEIDFVENSSSHSSPKQVANKKRKVNGNHSESQSSTEGGRNGAQKIPAHNGEEAVDEQGGFEIGDEQDEEDNDDDDDDDNRASRDSYTAYLDPDLLHEFLDWNGFTMYDGTAFFLLMTFPYYEHEWDIVGYVLAEVFGGDDDNSDDDGKDKDKECH